MMYWLVVVLFPATVHVLHGPGSQKSLRIFLVFLVRRRELEVDEYQQSEDHGLEETDQQFQEVEGNRNNTAQDRGEPLGTMKNVSDVDHGREHVLTGEDIAVESQREGDRANKNGDNLKNADKKEERNQKKEDRPGHSTLHTEQLLDEGDRTSDLHGPIEPEAHRYRRHRDGHVHVRSSGAKQGNELVPLVPTDGTNSGKQTKPIRDKDENEERPKKAKRLPGHLVTKNSLNGAVKTLDDRFKKILPCTRDDFDLAGAGTNDPHDDPENNCGDENRVGEPSQERMCQELWRLRGEFCAGNREE